MRFDLADLRLFLQVVEAGSITHGAERAHLALAAASTRIRNMEAALGTPLLYRERQGVQPTPAAARSSITPGCCCSRPSECMAIWRNMPRASRARSA